jgi:hypothetical protein
VKLFAVNVAGPLETTSVPTTLPTVGITHR